MSFRGAFPLLALLALSAPARAQSGQELMEESLRRHRQPDHVYEEQALVLTDRAGQQTLRTLRLYALRDAGGSRTLWVIETPADARGTAIYVARDADGERRRGAAASSPVFGSSFAVADLDGEQPHYYRYEREGDHDLERVPHYVLRATPADAMGARGTGYHERRIYLRKDNLFISRIDYRDREGRTVRRQSCRDPRPGEAGAWWPGMILMEDLRNGDRALLKIERRVHSPDYVPATVFADQRVQP